MVSQKKCIYRNVFSYLFIFFMPSVFGLLYGQKTMPPLVDSVVVDFETAPAFIQVIKTPLKYNKDFAMSFQMDDALREIYTDILPVFSGSDGSSGLHFTDGCGNLLNFKMSSAIYIFTSNGTDLLDPNDPWHDKSKLTWSELRLLHKLGWGIENHGLFDNPDIANSNIINYAFNRTLSYARRKISPSLQIKTFVIPNNVTTYINYFSQHKYHAALNQGQDNTWIGYGKNGFNVESDTINWLKPVKLNRSFIYDGFKKTADQLFANSKNGKHLWFLSGMHYLPGSFINDMKSIEQVYGADGMDNIWIANDDEILDYLAIKQAITVKDTLTGTHAVITFQGDIPTDRLFYALTLKIKSDAIIKKIQVYKADKYSYTGVGRDSSLVNISWKGAVIPSPELLADSFAQQAVFSGLEWDALVAMDYVNQISEGQIKVKLKESLCALNQTGWKFKYEEGFCSNVYLGEDSTICEGNCVNLTGTTGMAEYVWEANGQVFSQTKSVKVCPKYTSQYKLSVKNNNGKAYSDSIIITVNPNPKVILSHDTTLFTLDSLPLFANSNTGVKWKWNTGADSSVIYIHPSWNMNKYFRVQVSGKNGCVASDSVHIIVPPKDSVPTLTISIDTLKLCSGESTEFIAESNTRQFVWRMANKVDTTTQNKYKVVSPLKSNWIYVRGCNSFGCSKEDSAYFKILQAPVINHITDDTTVCAGGLLSLSGNGGESWQWSTSNDTLSFNKKVKIYPLKSEKYYFKIWNNDGCSSLDSLFVSVNKLPAVKILTDTTKVCKGNLINLKATGAVKYNWFPFNDSSTSLKIQVNDTMQIKLFGTDTFGCNASDSIKLDVLPLPNTSIITDTNSVCIGKEVLLTAAGNNIYKFLWKPTGDTSKYLNYIVTDTIVISLKGVNHYGCHSADSIKIFALPLPKTKIDLAVKKVCNGSLITIKGIGASSYTWLPSYDTNTIMQIKVKDTSNIHLIGINEYGCQSVDSIVIFGLPLPKTIILKDTNKICYGDTISLKAAGADKFKWLHFNDSSDRMKIQVKDTVTIKLMGINNYGCQNTDSIILYPLSLPKVDFYGLQSYFCSNDSSVLLSGSPDGGVFSGEGIEGNIFYPKNAGTGKHKIKYFFTDKNGCSSESVKTTIVSKKVPVIKLVPGDTTLQWGGNVTYDAGPGFTNYFWTTGDTTQIINVQYADYYKGTDTIKVVGLIGVCTSFGSALVNYGSKTTGIKKLKNLKFKLFPVPNKGKFEIELKAVSENLIFYLLDNNGRIVLKKQLRKGISKVKIKGGNISPGVYFAVIQSLKGFWSEKMIVK